MADPPSVRLVLPYQVSSTDPAVAPQPLQIVDEAGQVVQRWRAVRWRVESCPEVDWLVIEAWEQIE
jgi:hypothetical protein